MTTEPGQFADYAWHRRTITPSWDTKQRCTCGAEFVSQCEMWKHQADEYESLALTDWLSARTHSDGPDSGAAAHCERCSQGQFFDQERTVCECSCHEHSDGTGEA